MEIDQIGMKGAYKASASLSDDLYKLAKGSLKKWLKNSDTKKRIDEFLSNSTRVKYVKTVWQIDRDVDLTEFYYPTRILYDEKALVVSSLQDLKYKGPILVQGLAGQGKSIFLKYLCHQTATVQHAFPIYCELRKIHLFGSLNSVVFSSLEILGIKGPDSDQFKFLCNSRKVILFLDGFDEIPLQYRETALHEMESLYRKHKGLRIIVSSRPSSGIEVSRMFRIYKICPYTRADHPIVIKKLTGDQRLTDHIIQDIEKSPISVQDILITPLIITLLVLLYKSRQTIPASFSDLYDELFYVMLSRHDSSKPLYTRERRAKITDRMFRKAFSAFCYFSRIESLDYISHQDALQLAAKSIEYYELDVSCEDFLHDIITITCLLIKDGLDYVFVHKSIQEYFGAVLLTNLRDANIEKWYACLLDSPRWKEWKQVLLFLEYDDEERYKQYFILPLLEKTKILLSNSMNEGGFDDLFKDSSAEISLNNIGAIKFLSMSANEEHISYYLFASEIYKYAFEFFHLPEIKTKMLLQKNKLLKGYSEIIVNKGYEKDLIKLLRALDVVEKFENHLSTHLEENVESLLNQFHLESDNTKRDDQLAFMNV